MQTHRLLTATERSPDETSVCADLRRRGPDILPSIDMEVLARAVHGDHGAVREPWQRSGTHDFHPVSAVGRDPDDVKESILVVRTPSRAAARVETEAGPARNLIDAHDIAAPVDIRVDPDSLAVHFESGGSEYRQLAARVRVIGIRMPLSYPVVFICEVHIPELIVDRDGFDLRCAAVIAETPHERATDDAIRAGRQPILPEASIAATCLRRDDGEDGAVTGTLVEEPEP